ncbi:hypothetical protein HYQ46_003371 [Verticillium longisporum]|nr:hypothetical protein HYQ46_003371 [Verticillium longisporum]
MEYEPKKQYYQHEERDCYLSTRIRVGAELGNDEQHDTGANDGHGDNAQQQLRLPARLHNGGLAAVLVHGGDVVAEAEEEAAHAEAPKGGAEGLGHAQLELAGLRLEVEGQDNGDGDDGHVDAEAEVGEKGALVGAVVAGVGRFVLEEERRVEGPGPEGGVAVLGAEVGDVDGGGEGEADGGRREVLIVEGDVHGSPLVWEGCEGRCEKQVLSGDGDVDGATLINDK